MDIEKIQLRQKCKILRKSIDIPFYSTLICNIIKNWNIYQNSKNILIFSPIGSELSLEELLEDKSKKFYYPCVTGNSLCSALYKSELGFEISKFGIKEPVGPRISDCGFIDLAFIPALAADKQGFRLGYGKGYYDRFLTLHPDIIKAVPVSTQLLFDKIPTEAHDVRADYLITEKELISIKG